MLTQPQQQLLEEVVNKRQPGLMYLLDPSYLKKLSEDEIEELREVIPEELVDSGVNDDASEINKQGILLDELIGLIGSN